MIATVAGELDAVVDHEVEALGDRTTLEKFVMVAIWCIQEDPSLRPTMRKAVQMLEGVVEVPVPPCPSPIYFQVRLNRRYLYSQRRCIYCHSSS